MGRREILTTLYGEMLDMIACLAIHNGAEPAEKRRELSLEEMLEVR